jgi:hypothetical protein
MELFERSSFFATLPDIFPGVWRMRLLWECSQSR